MPTVIIENQYRSEQVSGPGNWVASHLPAANTQATITVTPPGAAAQHVVTSISCRLVSDGTAPTPVNATVNLIFGYSGDPASMSWGLAIQAVAGDRDQIVLTGLNVVVTVNTPVTIEFAAASGAHTFESVNITGYTRNRTPPA